MNRRKAIEQVSLILGGVLSAPILAGAMGKVLYTGEVVQVSAEQEALIADLANTIVPDTDTPGAKAAGVQGFIIRVMRDCYDKTEQSKFYNGLAQFEDENRKIFGKGFSELNATEKQQAMTNLTKTNKDLFLRFKELSITGYFTSEIGATQALAYIAVPGEFKACIPLQKGQKTWALN